MSEIESLRVGEWFYGPMALGSIVLNSIDCFCIVMVLMLVDQNNPRDLNSIFFQMIPFVLWNQFGRWTRE